jgi:diketogulonate reductase-like aldo/keto reductase
MHCQDTVDTSATWEDSYRALERSYSEGKVLSIGVSNFDIHLLRKLERMALVLPHIVQNWAEPGNMDMEVRAW